METVKQAAIENEAALVGMASKGDLEAFNQLVLHYQDIAYHIAFSILGESVSAEDATQDSFIKAFRQIHTFRGGMFRAWLLRIVTNTAYDYVRQWKRRPVQALLPEDDFGEELESPSWIVDPTANVEVSVDQAEDRSRLYQLIDELPEGFRKVLILVDIHELDYKEVGQILSLPVGTVKSRLARARLQMRTKLLADSANFSHLQVPTM